MEMPAQGGHDKSGMKRSGHTVSRNDQAQAGHEGESEAKKELVPCKRAERCALVSHKSLVSTRHGGESEAKSESCITQEPNGA